MTTTPRRRSKLDDLIDMVAELTRPHTVRTRYELRRRSARSARWKYNPVKVPSLLHQLEHAVPRSRIDDSLTAGGYGSRPTANLEALSTFVAIDHEARILLEQLSLTTSGTTQACVRRLLDPARTDHAVQRELRRWYAQARVVTGWDTPAWKPDSTCPMCGTHGSLRVRWHEEVGLCVECRETWDPTCIGLLAEHIRLESALRAVRRRPIPPACYCPLPMPDVTSLRLCPSCGSARCIRALTHPYDTPSQRPRHADA